MQEPKNDSKLQNLNPSFDVSIKQAEQLITKEAHIQSISLETTAQNAQTAAEFISKRIEKFEQKTDQEDLPSPQKYSSKVNIEQVEKVVAGTYRDESIKVKEKTEFEQLTDNSDLPFSNFRQIEQTTLRLEGGHQSTPPSHPITINAERVKNLSLGQHITNIYDATSVWLNITNQIIKIPNTFIPDSKESLELQSAFIRILKNSYQHHNRVTLFTGQQEKQFYLSEEYIQLNLVESAEHNSHSSTTMPSFSNMHQWFDNEENQYEDFLPEQQQQMMELYSQLFSAAVSGDEIDWPMPLSLREERLNSFEDIHNNVVKTKITINELFSKMIPTSPLNNVDGNTINRLTLLGRSGIGKSTIFRYLAYLFNLEDNYVHKPEAIKYFDCILHIPLRYLNNYLLNLYPLSADNYPGNIQYWELSKFIYFVLENEIGSNESFINCLKTKEKQPLSFCVIESLLQNQELNICILADGLDEVRFILNDQTHPKYFLLHQLLNLSSHKHIRTLLSSRPIDELPKLFSLGNKNCHCLELMGFDNEAINKYILNFFPTSDKNSALLVKLLTQLIMNTPILKGISHIPIILSMLCTIWQQQYKQFIKELRPDQSSIKNLNLTTIYNQLTHYLLTRLSNKQKAGEAPYTQQSAKNIQDRNNNSLVKFLEYVALSGMVSGQVLFSGQLILDAFNHRGITRVDEQQNFIQLLRECGFLSVSQSELDWNRGYLLPVSISFFHLSIQEFFAASAIKNAILNHQSIQYSEIDEYERWELSQCSYEEFIAKYKYLPSFEMIWPFVAGLLDKKHNVHLTPRITIEGLQSFWHCLFKAPRCMDITADLRLWMTCFNENPSSEVPYCEKIWTIINNLSKQLLMEDAHKNSDIPSSLSRRYRMQALGDTDWQDTQELQQIFLILLKNCFALKHIILEEARQKIFEILFSGPAYSEKIIDKKIACIQGIRRSRLTEPVLIECLIKTANTYYENKYVKKTAVQALISLLPDIENKIEFYNLLANVLFDEEITRAAGKALLNIPKPLITDHIIDKLHSYLENNKDNESIEVSLAILLSFGVDKIKTERVAAALPHIIQNTLNKLEEHSNLIKFISQFKENLITENTISLLSQYLLAKKVKNNVILIFSAFAESLNVDKINEGIRKALSSENIEVVARALKILLAIHMNIEQEDSLINILTAIYTNKNNIENSYNAAKILSQVYKGQLQSAFYQSLVQAINNAILHCNDPELKQYENLEEYPQELPFGLFLHYYPKDLIVALAALDTQHTIDIILQLLREKKHVFHAALVQSLFTLSTAYPSIQITNLMISTIFTKEPNKKLYITAKISMLEQLFKSINKKGDHTSLVDNLLNMLLDNQENIEIRKKIINGLPNFRLNHANVIVKTLKQVLTSLDSEHATLKTSIFNIIKTFCYTCTFTTETTGCSKELLKFAKSKNIKINRLVIDTLEKLAKQGDEEAVHSLLQLLSQEQGGRYAAHALHRLNNLCLIIKNELLTYLKNNINTKKLVNINWVIISIICKLSPLELNNAVLTQISQSASSLLSYETPVEEMELLYNSLNKLPKRFLKQFFDILFTSSEHIEQVAKIIINFSETNKYPLYLESETIAIWLGDKLVHYAIPKNAIKQFLNRDNRPTLLLIMENSSEFMPNWSASSQNDNYSNNIANYFNDDALEKVAHYYLHKRNHPQKAIFYYEKILEINPHHVKMATTYQDLACCYWYLNDYPNANRIFDLAIDSVYLEDNHALLVEYAHCLYQQEKYQAALRMLTHYFELSTQGYISYGKEAKECIEVKLRELLESCEEIKFSACNLAYYFEIRCFEQLKQWDNLKTNVKLSQKHFVWEGSGKDYKLGSIVKNLYPEEFFANIASSSNSNLNDVDSSSQNNLPSFSPINHEEFSLSSDQNILSTGQTSYNSDEKNNNDISLNPKKQELIIESDDSLEPNVTQSNYRFSFKDIKSTFLLWSEPGLDQLLEEEKNDSDLEAIEEEHNENTCYLS